MTDACVVLGYIAPDFFLGGSIAIDPDAARDAIDRDVARPLGLTTQEAAAGILDVACEHMAAAIEQVTLRQGVDARSAIMVAGGGGAGLYAVPVARRLRTPRILIPPVSATLSAAGALLSELTRSFTVHRPVSTAAFDYDVANAALAEVCTLGDRFLAEVGTPSSQGTVACSVQARYPDQVWEIEVFLDGTESFVSHGDIEAFERAFHRAHEALFAVADPRSSVEVLAWRARATSQVGGLTELLTAPAADGASPTPRRVFFPSSGTVEAEVRRQGALVSGDTIAGPALIESAVTTIVIPPGAVATRCPSGSIEIVPFAAETGASR